MLQIARATAFTISESLRENQLGGKITPIQIRVNTKLPLEPTPTERTATT